MSGATIGWAGLCLYGAIVGAIAFNVLQYALRERREGRAQDRAIDRQVARLGSELHHASVDDIWKELIG